MNDQSTSLGGDLFYNNLIVDYVDVPRFVPRPWLAKRVEAALDDASHRFLLLTAEPGVGKSAFMAWIARQHPDWPRYFIRRDQRSPLGDVGSRSLLLQIGFQLAATYPELFSREQVTVAVEQRIGMVAETGQAIGAEVERIVASPFHQAVVHVQQQVEENEGNVVGIRIGEWITNPRLISVEDLQYMALIDPAVAMLKSSPDKQIVILVDALDEIRYHSGQDNLLTWLATCPELPSNIRFVLSSRPDEALLARLRGAQQRWLHELVITAGDPHLDADIRAYALELSEEPAVKAALGSVQAAEHFVEQAVIQAAGNIGYLDAVARAIDQTLDRRDQQLLAQLVDLSDLPGTLGGLYAFFLHQLKDVVSRRSIEVEDSETGDVHFLSTWPAVYQRILGVLAVAREPLTLSQIERLGGIAAGGEYLVEAKEHLRQFLDQEVDGYRLYHATIVEFLTAESTRQNYDTQDLYQDAVRWHRRIAAYYRRGADSWEGVDWSQVDRYGFRHLAYHLHEARHKEELYALLTNSSEWMNSKFKVFADDTPYVTDLDLAISDFTDPLTSPGVVLTLIKLHAARHVVNARIGSYSDTALQTLVWLGREDEALNHARLRAEIRAKVDGVLTIYNALEEMGHPNHALVREVQEAAHTLPDEEQQMQALGSIVQVLVQVRRYEEAQEVARTYPNDRYRAQALTFIAKVLAQAGHGDQAKALLGEAQEAVRMLPNGWGRARALTFIVEALTQQGRYEEAQEAIRTIPDDERRTQDLDSTLTSIANALAQEGRYEKAQEAARTISGDAWQAEALTFIAAALAQAGHGDQAKALLGEAQEAARTIPNDWYRAQALASIAKVLAQEGRYEEAQEAARTILDDEWQTQTLASLEALTSLAKVLAQAGNDNQAKALLGEAQEAARTISDDEWRTQTLASIAEALVQVGHSDQAKLLLGEAQEAARTISASAHQADALASIAEVLAAQVGRYEQAQEAAHTTSDGEWWTQALDSTLASIAEALAQAGRYEEAQEGIVVTSLSAWQTEPLAPTLASIAGVLAQAGRYEEAQETVRIIPNYDQQIQALASMVEVLAQEGRYEEAQEAARTIPDDAWQAQALTFIAAALAQAGHGDQAKALLGEAQEAVRTMPDDAWQAQALTSIAEALAHAGRYEEAQEAVRAIPNYDQQIQALASMVEVLAQEGRYEEAQAAAHTIPDDAWQAQALASMVEALTQEGRYEEAQEAVRAIPDDEWQIQALAFIAAALFLVGHDDQAKTLLSEVQEAASALPDDEWRTQALASIVGTLVQEERYEEAQEAAHTISDDARRTEALDSIVEMLTQEGRYEEAQETARAIADDWGQARALVSIAAVLAKEGGYEEAQQAIRTIPDDEWRNQALASIAEVLAQAGHDDQAKALLGEAQEAAGALSDYVLRDRALVSIAMVLVQEGRYEEAQEAARTISDSDQREQALDSILEMLAQEGRYEEAQEAARTLSNGWSQAQALTFVARALAQAGHDDQAKALLSEAQEAVRTMPDEHLEYPEGRWYQAEVLTPIVEMLTQEGCYEEAQEAAHTILDDQYQAQALISIAVTLARVGSINYALTVLGLRGLDRFLAALAKCWSSFEQVEPGLSIAAVREATSVAGWLRPDWRNIHSDLLSTPEPAK